MQVLWWLVPPLVATLLAMGWASWAARTRHELGRDDSEEALERMQRALARPTPSKGTPVSSAALERTHGVAVRGAARRAAPVPARQAGHDLSAPGGSPRRAAPVSDGSR